MYKSGLPNRHADFLAVFDRDLSAQADHTPGRLKPIRHSGARDKPVSVSELMDKLTHFNPDDADVDLIELLHVDLVQHQHNLAHLVLQSGFVGCCFSWLRVANSRLCHAILSIFLELAKESNGFKDIAAEHFEILCEKMTVTIFQNALFDLFGSLTTSDPRFGEWLHRFDILSIISSVLFCDPLPAIESIHSVCRLLWSLSHADRLIQNEEQFEMCSDIVHFVLAVKFEWAEQTGLEMCCALNRAGFGDPHVLFDPDTLFLISNWFGSFAKRPETMPHLLSLVGSLCARCPDYASDFLDETAIMGPLKRFCQVRQGNFEMALPVLIQIAQISEGWSSVMLEWEFVQEIVCPRFHSSREDVKSNILFFFCLVGAAAPSAIQECPFVGEILPECLDAIASNSGHPDFPQYCLLMLSRLIERDCAVIDMIGHDLLVDTLQECLTSVDDEKAKDLAGSLLDSLAGA
jgi:hypothetical protein